MRFYVAGIAFILAITYIVDLAIGIGLIERFILGFYLGSGMVVIADELKRRLDS